MTEASVAAEPGPAESCPACGREIAAGAVRCAFCLAELAREPEQVRRPRGARGAAARWPAPAAPTSRRRLRWSWRWATLLATLALVVWLVGPWAYDRWFVEPAVLALPAERALQPTAPGVTWPAADGGALAERRTSARAAWVVTPNWERALGARVRTAAVADERHVYAGLDDDRIVALRLSDGELAWAFRSPNTLWSPPTVAGDTLYLTLRRGDVVALDAASGRERWSTAVGGSFFAAPVVADGVLYVAADEVIAGIEASSGRVLWRVPLDESRVVRAPLVLREHIVVTSGDGLLVFDRRTGVRTFEFPQTNPVGATSDGERVFSVATGFAVAIDPHERLPWWQGLRRLWTQVWIWGLAPLPPRPESLWIGPLRGDRLRGVQVPALGAELLFVADEPGTVRALRLANGGEAWSVQAGRQAGPPTLAADGLLLVGREALSLRSAGDGSELARLPLPAAERRQALVTERALVVLDGEGRVALHAAAP